ncbi:uncharacterized protein OCT59_007735 [Rhizophagus irregularis]|uniref:uncharacterized protein n=1 Tax=Rhizophagus irregularis TaxID=588596 RepID=UPI0033271B8E|nr:hypothetical protein OCT59_007735 [Rhizophagus irregularis]
MSEFSVKIDDTDVIENDVTDKDKIENYHNGKPITEIELSPKGRYLVTYSKEDQSIVGWNVENENEAQLEFEFSVNKVTLNVDKFNQQICISDDKKLAYIDNYDSLKLCDKMNDGIIELDFHKHRGIVALFCAFNLNDELILYNTDGNKGKYFICIYSLQSKNNKYKCKRMYWLPRENKQVSISRSDEFYLFSNNSIYEFNLTTEKMIKIFGIDEEINNDSFCKLRKNIRISRNEKLICTRFKDKIIIYSIELGIPIVSLNINNVNQLRMFMKYIFSYQQLSLLLFPLLLPLFNNIQSSEFWDAIIKDSKSLGHLKHYEQLPKEFLPNNIQVTSKFVFGILDGDVWMNDLEKVMLNMDTLLKSSDELVNNNFDEIIDNWYEYSGNHFKSKKEMYDYLIILLLNPYKETLDGLFKKVIRQLNNQYEPDGYSEPNDFNEQVFKWTCKLFRDEAIINKNKIELNFLKKNNDNDDWDCICKKVEDIKSPQNKILQENHKLIIEKYNRNDIIILTEIGLFIYHFNENSQSISLIYFYYMDISHIESTIKSTFKSTSLPLLNHNSFKVCNEWASNIKDNKNNLLKYGVELLSFAIKEHDSELIDDVYKKCINYFKEDLGNNKMCLSIITSTMPLLNEYYPEYISRYSSETVMIIDSPFYSIEYDHTKLHLYSYQHHLQIINITQSIWWLNYCKSMEVYEASYMKKKTKSNFSFDERTNSNDPNNPWNIVPSYNLVLENGAIGANPYIIQQPNGNTNMFVDFKTSLFAMYLFLTGDSSALTNWPYISNPSIAILIVLFSLLIVVYLMNLFIGLLNMAIEKDNNRVSYLMQKAEILAEIELFYLLPYQRRYEKWFPEVIYYYANVDKTREKIKEMMKNDEWNTDEFTELKQALLEKLNIKYNPDK